MDIFNITLFYFVIYSAGLWCSLNAIWYISKLLELQWEVKNDCHKISESDTKKKRNGALFLVIFWVVIAVTCFLLGIFYEFK